ncbi:MAG: hypothetical protein ACOYBL_07255 [Lachnospiraceae bacterium]
MKRSILAVCDLEKAYAYHFMEYINQKKSIPFEIQAFTSAQLVAAYAKEHAVEILLISDKAMCAEIAELEIGKIIILSEGVHAPLLDQFPSVYKYQSSDAVIREVMACYGEGKEVQPLSVIKNKTELIGIYSPVGRVLKTSFALTMGQVLARQKAVLYLNLEEYSGFETLFSQVYEHNLSDLLYYIRQDHSNIVLKLNRIVQSVNNLDYLPPVLSPADIRSTTAQEWTQLIEEIVKNSVYETVILDFGDGVDDLYHILNLCDRIYMPVVNDMVSQAKISQFENLLVMWDMGELLNKIEKIRPPYHNSFGNGDSYVQQLMWSELGDYVRNLLRSEKERG